MTHYLRTRFGDTLVDIDTQCDDISSGVIITTFGAMLLCLRRSRKQEFIEDMHAMNELRGEYWEAPGRSGPSDSYDLETSDQLAKRRCKELAKKWGLDYVTD